MNLQQRFGELLAAAVAKQLNADFEKMFTLVHKRPSLDQEVIQAMICNRCGHSIAMPMTPCPNSGCDLSIDGRMMFAVPKGELYGICMSHAQAIQGLSARYIRGNEEEESVIEDDPQRILQVLSDGTIAKWEYKRVVMHYPHGFNAQTITSDSGWELVSVILAKDGLEIGYFKREVKDAV